MLRTEGLLPNRQSAQEERRRGETVLFPIRLDNAVMETLEAWAADIRRQRNIGDFRGWEDHDTYQKAFGRLLRDLKSNILGGPCETG